MKEHTSASETTSKLQPYLSPLAVWALSVGSAIGWGSLVVTSKTYLSQAGPAGSVIGLLIGFAMMLMVANHYTFLSNRYPGTGGLYNYIKHTFGYDRAFLVGWFMFLVYISIFWANATSIPLFARYFLQGIFKIGYLYTIFGYEVYLGETLVTLLFMILIGLLCMKSKRATARCMEVMALVFTIGITVCFVVAILGHGRTGMSMEPAFIPDVHAFRQVIRIAFISPWAFIGFESVSHSVEEYRIRQNSMFRILLVSLIVITALYIFIILLSTTAYPEGCSSWLDYITHLDHFEGLEGLPAFYAANYYMGKTGVYILMASLLALVFSSLIGMLRTLSRLCYAVALDGILPERFAELNDKQIPVNTILLILLVSLPIPFLGRTTIGWIVDTTTIGATILYGFASAAVFKVSGEEGCKKERFISSICLCILIAFMVFLLFPSFFSDYTIETETYALMTAWSILGIFFFNGVIRKDHARKFGKAIIVWMTLLAFIVLVATTWAERVNESRESVIVEDIRNYTDGTADNETLALDKDDFFEMELRRLHAADNVSAIVIMSLFALSLAVMLINFLSMQKWEKKAAQERDHARNVAMKDPMTGVKSKHAFLVDQKEYDSAIEEKTVEHFAVAVCDVNGLKVINDTLGHKAGDEYIFKASRMICDIFAHSPVYRTGGDEFVAILTGRDYMIRKDLILALHDRSVEHISTRDVVVSGGLSEYKAGEDKSFHDVFERADALMYEEKKLLKSMGSITREDAEEAVAAKPVVSAKEKADLLRIRRHILIAEDERVDQMILANMLEDKYDLLYASDGSEALEKIKTNKDDLAMVLLDLQMPLMNGMEVLMEMKKEDGLKDIPVIVLTADQSAEVECLRIGALDFIPKPYPSSEVILARVNRCIELSENRIIIESTERESLTKLLNLDYFLHYFRIHDQHFINVAMDAIVIGIHDFRALSDRCGKHYSDSLLTGIGEHIRDIEREIGGLGCHSSEDTFFIYCPHQEDYESILDKVCEGLQEKDPSGNKIRLRMGVYPRVDKTVQIERRFACAEAAAESVDDDRHKAIGIFK